MMKKLNQLNYIFQPWHRYYYKNPRVNDNYALGHTNLIFWFTSTGHRKSGSVGRNIFIYVNMNLIISHDNPKVPRENLSCSISTWSLSLKSHHWAPQRSFPGVTKSLRIAFTETTVQGTRVVFPRLTAAYIASYVINWWPHHWFTFISLSC